MGVAEEGVCAFAMFCGFILTIATVADPKWQTSDPDTIISEPAYRYIGLWDDCQIAVGGSWTCNDLDGFFLNLPAHVQAGRGFSITAAVLSFFATLLTIITVTTMPCANNNAQARNRTRLIASLLGFLAGISMFFATGWYTKAVSDEYYLSQISSSGLTNPRMIIGEGIFIGVVAGTVLFFTSIAAACVSCRGNAEESYPTYRPPISRSIDKEYV